MVITPGTLAYLDVLRRDIDAGKLTNETAATDLAKPSVSRGLRAVAGAMGLKGPGRCRRSSPQPRVPATAGRSPSCPASPRRPA